MSHTTQTNHSHRNSARTCAWLSLLGTSYPRGIIRNVVNHHMWFYLVQYFGALLHIVTSGAPENVSKFILPLKILHCYFVSIKLPKKTSHI